MGKGALAVSVSVVLSTAAAAQDLPGHWKYASEINDSQFGYTDVHIDANGRVAATTLFSNGSRLDGDHFVARIVVFAEDDTPLLGMQYGAGINATGGFGSANETRVGEEAVLDPGLANLVASVGVAHSTRDAVDDAAFWEKVGDIARTLWQAYQSREQNSAAMVTGIPIGFRGEADGVSLEIGTVPDVGKMSKASRIELPPATQGASGASTSKAFFEDRICLDRNCASSILR
ncbi:hypothetical protein [Palleronia rufa]|uniref:hypothetical protein n=1 Tax=Palleronia rufa TaxID=1530186 RepID=UPI00055DD01F|nr:hypothetical protein [Palleronia rufa]